jgi:hypothetical protein
MTTPIVFAAELTGGFYNRIVPHGQEPESKSQGLAAQFGPLLERIRLLRTDTHGHFLRPDNVTTLSPVNGPWPTQVDMTCFSYSGGGAISESKSAGGGYGKALIRYLPRTSSDLDRGGYVDITHVI